MAYEWSEEQPTEEPTEADELLKRIHRVFAQSDDGKKLLSEWERLLVQVRTDMNPSVYKVGFLDGQSHFIKVIKLTIERVENE